MGTNRLPLQSPVSHRATAPGYPDGAEFYRVDIRRLSPDEFWRLAAVLARDFAVPIAEVKDGLLDPAIGCPVLAEDVMVSFDMRLVI